MPNRNPADRFAPYRTELLINDLATGLMFASVAATKHDTNPESSEWALAHAEISYQSALLFLATTKNSDSVLPEEIKKITAHTERLREKIEEAKRIRKDR